MKGKVTTFIILLSLIWCCAEKEFDPDDPKGSFAIAKEPYDDEDYERAVERLGEYKSRFPYSKYAVEAELLLANSHFELGNYEEAATAYLQFVKLHPKHPQLDYAMFRVGESYWEDSPEEIDREQEYTEKAITEWEKLIKERPQSEYTAKAKKLVDEGKRRIAESYDFISRFYCKLEIYHSCAYRYILLAEKYPEFEDLKINALKKAAEALDILADMKQQDPKSDENIYFQTMTVEQIRAKAKELRVQIKK